MFCFYYLGGEKIKRLPRPHAIKKSKRILHDYVQHWRELANGEVYDKQELRELYREELEIDQNITDKLYKFLIWHDLDGGIRLKDLESVTNIIDQHT